jgi:hypothetical protein
MNSFPVSSCGFAVEPPPLQTYREDWWQTPTRRQAPPRRFPDHDLFETAAHLTESSESEQLQQLRHSIESSQVGTALAMLAQPSRIKEATDELALLTELAIVAYEEHYPGQHPERLRTWFREELMNIDSWMRMLNLPVAPADVVDEAVFTTSALQAPRFGSRS